MPETRVGLAAAIQELRKELVAAIAEGDDADLRFALGPVELELELELTNQREGQAGIAAWVLTAGGKTSRGETSTHTIRLTLTPVGPGGKPSDVIIRDRVDDID